LVFDFTGSQEEWEEVRASLEWRLILPQMDKMHTDSSGFAADWFLNYETRKNMRKRLSLARSLRSLKIAKNAEILNCA